MTTRAEFENGPWIPRLGTRCSLVSAPSSEGDATQLLRRIIERLQSGDQIDGDT